MTKTRTAASGSTAASRPPASAGAARRPIDRIIFIVAVVQPLLTLPQAVLIFTQHAATGVSLGTWVGYEIFTCIWFVYAVVHRIKPIIMNECIWFTLQGAVIIGILRYG